MRAGKLRHKTATPYKTAEKHSRGPRSSGQHFDTCTLIFLQHHTTKTTSLLPVHLQDSSHAPSLGDRGTGRTKMAFGSSSAPFTGNPSARSLCDIMQVGSQARLITESLLLLLLMRPLG